MNGRYDACCCYTLFFLMMNWFRLLLVVPSSITLYSLEMFKGKFKKIATRIYGIAIDCNSIPYFVKRHHFISRTARFQICCNNLG